MDRVVTFGTGLDVNGHRIFVDENLAAGTNGTDVPAAYMTSLQEEVLGVIEATGQTPDANSTKQVWRGIAIIGTNRAVLNAGAGTFLMPIPPGKAAGDLIRTQVTGVGAGGSGMAGTTSQAGAGGGAGAIGQAFYDFIAGSSYAYVVGAGGAPGVTGGQGDATTGLFGGYNGGDTSITSPAAVVLMLCKGGSAGVGSNSASAGGTGGARPTASGNIGGLLASGGGDGEDASPAATTRGGGGAPGPWGGNGRAGYTVSGGIALGPALGYGAGGGGSYGPGPGNSGGGGDGVLMLDF